MPKNSITTSQLLAEGLSEVLKERRLELGFSQAELSSKTGLHRTYISELERGHQNLTIETLVKLAEELETSVLLLIEDASRAVRLSSNPMRILLAEDSSADVHMIDRSLKAATIPAELTVVADGREALDYLRNADSRSQLPDLIFLELHLPRKNGYEVLREIKADERLKLIPVVVLTNSKSAVDVSKSYELHANSFITKPSSHKNFQKAINQVLEYWFAIVSLPSPKSSSKG